MGLENIEKDIIQTLEEEIGVSYSEASELFNSSETKKSIIKGTLDLSCMDTRDIINNVIVDLEESGYISSDSFIINEDFYEVDEEDIEL